MKIVIFGATGLIGANLYKSLLNIDYIKNITLITRSDISDKYNNDKISNIVLPDMGPESIKALDLEFDALICCLGTTIKKAGSKAKFKSVDYDLICACAELVKIKNAKTFIFISALGANLNSKIFYNKVKGETEQFIKNLNLNSVYCLRPSLLIGDRSETRLGESIGIGVFKLLAPLLPSNIEKKLGTRVSDIINHIPHCLKENKKGFHIIESKDIN